MAPAFRPVEQARGAVVAPVFRRFLPGRVDESVDRWSSAPLLRLRRHERFKSGDQRRQIVLHRVPHETDIDIKIGVHEPIPHTDEFRPRYLGVRSSGVKADTAGGLADDLDGLEDSVLVQTVPLKLRERQPATNATASRAASSMSRRKASSRRIDRLRGTEDGIAADVVPARLDRRAFNQIDPATEYPAQLVLHARHVQERSPRLLVELDKHVDIAVRPKIWAER